MKNKIIENTYEENMDAGGRQETSGAAIQVEPELCDLLSTWKDDRLHKQRRGKAIGHTDRKI